MSDLMTHTLAVTRAELFKVVRRPAAWTLLAAAAVLSQVFGYLIPYLSFRGGGGPMEGASPDAILASTLPSQLVSNTLGGFPVFAGALAMVLGALMFGSEYGWGTVKTQLTQRPGRTSVVLGQWLAMAAAIAVGVLLLFALGSATSAGIAAAEGRSMGFPSPSALLAGYGAGVAIMLMWGSLGAGLGSLLRGVALPVGLGVVWALGVENLISGVAASVLTGLQPLRDALPGVNSGSLVSAVMSSRPVGVDAPPGVNSSVADGQALATVLVYVVVGLAVSWWTSRRRDVA